MSSPTLPAIAMDTISLPSDLALKPTRPEHRLHEQLEVVADGGAVLDVDVACIPQDAAPIKQPTAIKVR